MNNSLFDKIILLFISLSIYLYNVSDNYLIAPILISIFLSAIISYKSTNKVLIFVFISFLFLILPYTLL